MAGVLEEVARLQVRLDDVNSFLFTHPLNKEPMVFYVPNKAVRNSLKLHVNEGGGYVVGSLKSREAKHALQNGLPVYTIVDAHMPSDNPLSLAVNYLLDCLKTNKQQPLEKYQLHATVQVDVAQVDAAQVDAVQVDAAQVDAAQVDAAQVDAVQVDAVQVDAVQSPNAAKRNLLADFVKDGERGKSPIQHPLDAVDRELVDVLSVLRDTSADEEKEKKDEKEVRKGRRVKKKRVHIVIPSSQSSGPDEKEGQENCMPSQEQSEGQAGLHPLGEPSTTSSIVEQDAVMRSPHVGSEEGTFNIEELQWAMQERTVQAIIKSGRPVLSPEEKLTILADLTGMGIPECSRALSCMSHDMLEALKYLGKVNTALPWTKEEDEVLVDHLQAIHRQLGWRRSLDSVIARLQFLASQSS